MGSIKFDDLPDLTAQHLANPAQAIPILRQWKQTMQKMIGTIGPNRGKAAWYQSLIDNGLLDDNGNIIPPGGGDLSPPTAPTGFSVGAALSHVFVSTDPPLFSNGGGYQKTKVYGATYSGTGPLPTFATAVVIDEFTGQFEAVPENPGTEWHLWVSWVSKAGVEGLPAGGTNGLVATTGLDVSSMLDVLSAAALDPNSPYVKTLFRADLFGIVPTADFYQDTPTPTASATGDLWFAPTTGVTKVWNGSAWVVYTVTLPFVVTTVPVTQNGQTAPPGVYIQNGYIANGTITTAMIGLAQIDDALVANLSAAKLIAGSLWVGASAQSSTYVAGSSGWHIDSSGSVEFNTGVFRGTVFASAGSFTGAVTATSGSFTGSIFAGAGTIAGNTITGSDIHSPSFAVGSTGWQLTSGGAVYATELHVKDSTGLRIFDTQATGTNPVLKIGSAILIDAAGNASFGGTLTASNIVDTAQLVPNAVTAVVTASNPGSISVPTGSPTVVATASVTTSGEPVVVFANGFISTSSGTSTSALGVYRDGVLLFVVSGNSVNGVQLVWSGIDSPAAGAHTYTVEGSATFAGCNASARSLGLMQAKR